MFIRKVILADGLEYDLEGIRSLTEIATLLGADSLYIVALDDGIHIMLFNDEAYSLKLPINYKATEICKLKDTTKHYTIQGDVVIIPNRDLDRDTAAWTP
jgi:hypothetical protein